MNISESAKELYRVEKNLDAPVKVCFDAGYLEEALLYWAPSCKSVVYDQSKAEFPYGPGASRLITLNSGGSVTEVIEISESPTLLGYNIPTFGNVADKLIKNYHGRMHFEAIDDTHTRLVWQGYGESSGWRLSVAKFILTRLMNKMTNKLAEYVAQKP